MDELNCPDNQCFENEYQCSIVDTDSFYCLSKSQLYSNYLSDCDDPLYFDFSLGFYNGTENIHGDYYSWNRSKCINNDLCRVNDHAQNDWCLYESPQFPLTSIRNVHLIPTNEYLCSIRTSDERNTGTDIYVAGPLARFFRTIHLGYFPSMSMNISTESTSKRSFNGKLVVPSIDSQMSMYCHRGISVLINFNRTIKCFCPLNYFGEQCQWQNQRISLTIQFIWRSSTSKPVIMLYR